VQVLDTVSIIEEAALKATCSSKPEDVGDKDIDMKDSIQSHEPLPSSSNCPVKRKSDTEIDVNCKLPKRSSLVSKILSLFRDIHVNKWLGVNFTFAIPCVI